LLGKYCNKKYVEIMKRLLPFLLLPLLLGGWSDAPQCLWRVETRFFEPRTVKEAFDLYHVFQSQWNPILTDLYYNVQEIPQRIRAKAHQMSPDPFEHPYDAEKIKALIFETEFEVFRETMVKNHYYDLSATYGMFDYIKSHQEKWIDECLSPPSRAKNVPIR
jgi:hypothetical protein